TSTAPAWFACSVLNVQFGKCGLKRSSSRKSLASGDQVESSLNAGDDDALLNDGGHFLVCVLVDNDECRLAVNCENGRAAGFAKATEVGVGIAFEVGERGGFVGLDHGWPPESHSTS